MNRKHFFVLLLLSGLALNCDTKETSTEIEIPERESFVAKKSEFTDPANIKTNQGPFDMPGLSYDFEEFRIVDPKTAFIHYQNYHLSYANALNTAIHNTIFEKDSLVDILKKVKQDNPEIKNYSGAYYNHNIYWLSIDPIHQTTPKDEILKAINDSFGSVDQFNILFKQTALTHVGSGWIWLIKRPNDTLEILWTPNNENPLSTASGVKILLGIDLWEHAYMSTYPNDSKAYLENCLKHLNWQYANLQYIKK